MSAMAVRISFEGELKQKKSLQYLYLLNDIMLRGMLLPHSLSHALDEILSKYASEEER